MPAGLSSNISAHDQSAERRARVSQDSNPSTSRARINGRVSRLRGVRRQLLKPNQDAFSD
jgi:hypothetical protein